MSRKKEESSDSDSNKYVAPDLSLLERFGSNLEEYIETNDFECIKIIIDEKNVIEHKSKSVNFISDHPKNQEKYRGRVKREKKGANYVYYYEHETLGLENYRVLKAENRSDGIYIYDIRGRKNLEVAKMETSLLGSKNTFIVDGKEQWMLKYDTNMIYKKLPRKFTIFGRPINYGKCAYHSNKSITESIKNEEWENITIFVNKPPQYNPVLRTFMLNFQGRTTNPSIKNFQLINLFDAKEVLMTFGKQTNDIFVLEFSYPFCILDAFFFSLCSMTDKAFMC